MGIGRTKMAWYNSSNYHTTVSYNGPFFGTALYAGS